MPNYSVVILTAIAVSVAVLLIAWFISQQIKAADRIAKMYAERNAKREVVIDSLKRNAYVGTPVTWGSHVAKKQSDTARKATVSRSRSSSGNDDSICRNIVSSTVDTDCGSSSRYSDYSCGSSDTSSSASCD